MSAAKELAGVAPTPLLAALASHAAAHADDRAVTHHRGAAQPADGVSYGGLWQAAGTVASALTARGLAGERVLLVLPTGIDFLAVFLGCLRAGVIAVPLPSPEGGRVERLASVAHDCAPKLVIADAELAARLAKGPLGPLAGAAFCTPDELRTAPAKAFGERAPADVAFLQYTSGSTGDPKGAVVTHGNLAANTRYIQKALGMGPADGIVSCLPLYHDMGLIGTLLAPLYTRAQTHLYAPSTLFRPSVWLKALGELKATISVCPNFAYDFAVERISDAQLTGLDLRSVRILVNGAEPVRAETLERFNARFGPAGLRPDAFTPCYGLAETTLLTAARPQGTPLVIAAFDAAALERGTALPVAAMRAPGAVRRLVGNGRAISPDAELTIVDPQSGEALAPHQIGEIVVRGASVVGGYWGRSSGQDSPFRGGALHTGDLGFVAADGELFITGRAKDLIIVRGRNIYPQDVEATAAAALAGSRLAAAFGVDQGHSEGVVVVVETRTPADEPLKAVREAVLSEHGIDPVAILFVRPGFIPRTSSGKVRRRALKELYHLGLVGTTP